MNRIFLLQSLKKEDADPENTLHVFCLSLTATMQFSASMAYFVQLTNYGGFNLI